jgi:dTDP-4-dehydrorhamnose 3,5-epimerase
LETHFAQCSTSHSLSAGTLRGMHFQRAPDAEVKLVRCVRGRIYDVVIDLRPRSATYRAWLGFHLGPPADDFILYVPRGFAHGFQTLADDTEVTYQISDAYAPRSADGVRYDDPAFGIDWPLPIAAISQKDGAWPLLDDRDPPFAGWVDEVQPAPASADAL